MIKRHIFTISKKSSKQTKSVKLFIFIEYLNLNGKLNPKQKIMIIKNNYNKFMYNLTYTRRFK